MFVTIEEAKQPPPENPLIFFHDPGNDDMRSAGQHGDITAGRHRTQRGERNTTTRGRRDTRPDRHRITSGMSAKVRALRRHADDATNR